MTATPCIVLIHGLLAGDHMRRHLLRWLHHAGFTQARLFSHHARPASIARWIRAQPDGPRVLIGYSQGGFQVVKVARRLAQDGFHTDLLVTVAAGGLGRWYPPQWGMEHRQLPAQVKRALNFYALDDRLGTDATASKNLMRGKPGDTWVENHAYPAEAGIGHAGLVRCYPESRVHPSVDRLFLTRLKTELMRLKSAHSHKSQAAAAGS